MENQTLTEEVLARLRVVHVPDNKTNNEPESDKIREIYEKVGFLLGRYKSGKLPKAFKVIPTLKNWEKVLLMTSPENWTTNAVLEATRIFVSNLSPKMAQRYLEFVLLPRVRQNIAESKKLDPHLYEALRKSIYKPASFFKGIIIPLCQSDDMTLREASIFSSILSKYTIPILHSATALFKLLRLPFNGGRAIFIKAILDKKYALPSSVIDAVVEYFCRGRDSAEPLPVLWHQALLVFCQRYKNDLSDCQRQMLEGLVKVQAHEQISPEICREISDSGLMQP